MVKGKVSAGMLQNRRTSRRLIRLVILFLLIVAACAATFRFLPDILLIAFEAKPQGNIDDMWASLVATNNPSVPRQNVLSTYPPTTAPTAVHSSPSVTTEPVQSQSQISTPALSGSEGLTLASPENTATPVAFDSRESIRIFSPGYIDIQLTADETFAESIEFEVDDNGEPVGIVRYEEAALQEFCTHWQDYCENPRFRLEALEFRNGGFIVYASLNIANLWWQDVALAVRVHDHQVGFEVVGIIWNNVVYALSPSSPLTQTVNSLLERGNQALQQLQIQIGTARFQIDQLDFEDNALTIVLQ